MKYHVLTGDQQYQIVEGKVRQYEQNLLVATVDRAAAEAADEGKQAADLASQIAKWEKARDAAQKILDGMKKPAPVTPREGPPARIAGSSRPKR